MYDFGCVIGMCQRLGRYCACRGAVNKRRNHSFLRCIPAVEFTEDDCPIQSYNEGGGDIHHHKLILPHFVSRNARAFGNHSRGVGSAPLYVQMVFMTRSDQETDHRLGFDVAICSSRLLTFGNLGYYVKKISAVSCLFNI
jgi:hypothetical protein